MNKKEIYLDLSKLSRNEIFKVYEFLDTKGEHIVCEYSGYPKLAYVDEYKGWNDYIEVYNKKEVSLSDFYELFNPRSIEFAYFSDIGMLNEWYNALTLDIISLNYDFEFDRHVVYYKVKAS